MGSPRTRLGSKLGGSISPKPQKGKRYLFLASGVGFPVPAAREAGFSPARPPSSRTGPPRGERERALFSGPSACMLPPMKRPAGIRAGRVRGFGIGAVQRDAGVDTRRACARLCPEPATENVSRRRARAGLCSVRALWRRGENPCGACGRRRLSVRFLGTVGADGSAPKPHRRPSRRGGAGGYTKPAFSVYCMHSALFGRTDAGKRFGSLR